MPDILLMVIAFIGIVSAIGSLFAAKDEPAWVLAAFLFGGVAALDIWWWSAAWTTLQTHPTKLVESFPVQTITLDDGSKYQIYIDYGDGEIHNVTQRWNKIVPDGTMVVRLEIQGRWAKGVRFIMASETRDELRGPLDDRWNEFSGLPNERIENDN